MRILSKVKYESINSDFTETKHFEWLSALFFSGKVLHFQRKTSISDIKDKKSILEKLKLEADLDISV